MVVGTWQIVVIILAFVILFGTGKIGNFMTELAKGLKAFEKIMRGDNDDIKEDYKKYEKKYEEDDFKS